jgi:hypothetical protein
MTRWMCCPWCYNVQPVTDPHFNYGGFEQAECEFCESDTGPRMVLLPDWEVTDTTDEEINMDKRKYEQRTNNNK